MLLQQGAEAVGSEELPGGVFRFVEPVGVELGWEGTRFSPEFRRLRAAAVEPLALAALRICWLCRAVP